MRKPPRTSAKAKGGRDDLRPEYRFDYNKSRANRFASRVGGSGVAVVLEPDVARVFDAAESVNQLLRSVISALVPRRRPRAIHQ